MVNVVCLYKCYDPMLFNHYHLSLCCVQCHEDMYNRLIKFWINNDWITYMNTSHDQYWVPPIPYLYKRHGCSLSKNPVLFADDSSVHLRKIARGIDVILKAKTYVMKYSLISLDYSLYYSYFTYCNHVFFCFFFLFCFLFFFWGGVACKTYKVRYGLHWAHAP